MSLTTIRSLFSLSLAVLAIVHIASTAGRCATSTRSAEKQDELNTKIGLPEFLALSHRCAPEITPRIMHAIARTESAMYPYAISINYPIRSARQKGYGGKVIMLRQPRDKTQAIHWAKWYLDKGYTVSVGLVQVNVEMANKLHIKPMTLFDPCINLAAGAKILHDDLQTVPQTEDGLIQAFSLYNSGSSSLGIANGYASTVIDHARR